MEYYVFNINIRIGIYTNNSHFTQSDADFEIIEKVDFFLNSMYSTMNI